MRLQEGLRGSRTRSRSGGRGARVLWVAGGTRSGFEARPAVLAGLFLLGLVSALGCAVSGGVSEPAAVCAQVDSLYSHSGFQAPLTLTGKATVDANQYRIRGIIRADFTPAGDVYLDFSSSVLFGSQIEDFFFSMVADTLRIVDRERGHFYQGEEAQDFLCEVLGMDFDVVSTLRLASGGHPPCDDLRELRVGSGAGGGFRLEGRHAGEKFGVRFSAGRLESAEWAVRGDDGRNDRLTVQYRWADPQGADLRQLVLRLEERDWRCRITAID